MKSLLFLLLFAIPIALSETCRADINVFVSGGDLQVAPDYTRNFMGPHEFEVLPFSDSFFIIRGLNGTLVNGTVLRFLPFPGVSSSMPWSDDLKIDLPYGSFHDITIAGFVSPGWDDVRINSSGARVHLEDVTFNLRSHSGFFMSGYSLSVNNCTTNQDFIVDAHDAGFLSSSLTVGRNAQFPKGHLDGFAIVGNVTVLAHETLGSGTHLSNGVVGGTLTCHGRHYYDDDIQLTNVAMSRLRLYLYGGNDFVTFDNCSVSSSVYADGGPGDDSWIDIGGNSNFTLNSNNSVNFEE